MTNNQIVQHQIHAVFLEVQYLIRLLYVTQDVYMRNLTFNHLWNKIDQLQFLIQLDQTTPTHPKPIMPIQQPSTQPRYRHLLSSHLPLRSRQDKSSNHQRKINSHIP